MDILGTIAAIIAVGTFAFGVVKWLLRLFRSRPTPEGEPSQEEVQEGLSEEAEELLPWYDENPDVVEYQIFEHPGFVRVTFLCKSVQEYPGYKYIDAVEELVEKGRISKRVVGYKNT